MSMQPLSHRSLINSLYSQTDVLVSQRFSQTLLLNLLRYISLLYLVMAVFSIPLWVLSLVEMRNQLKLQQKVQIADILMLTTISYLESSHQKSLNCPHLISEFTSSKQSPAQLKNNHCKANENPDYLIIGLYYDIFLQMLLCFGYSLIEYKSFKTKQHHKGNHIEDYSLQISNIPVTHPYIMLPKLQQHLMSEFNTHFELIGGELQLFDTISIAGQQSYMQSLLQSELETRMSQMMCDDEDSTRKKRVKQIEVMLKKVDTANVKEDIVWVTFETRQARYLARRLLQSTHNKFMNRKLRVRKAPHPQQIYWQNMHTPFIKMFLSHNVSLIVCMGLLFLFDLLILYIHKSSYPLLASLMILLLEIVLKSIIITVSSFEKHHHKSSLNVSIFTKLTKYLYINNALIIFVSCFNFMDNAIVQTFSSSTYKTINQNWFKGVGMSIMLSFIIQIGYVNIRPAIEVVKGYLRRWIKLKWNQLTQKVIEKEDSQIEIERIEIQRLKSELEICYAHIVSLLMFANTYSFTHPILYPLVALFAFLAYHTHRKYIANYTQPAPYNNDYLNSASIQYLYFSLIAHWALLAIGFLFLPALICAAFGTVILIFKNSFFRFLSEIGRKKFGPFCFSKFERSHASTIPLHSLLTNQQLNTHIENFQEKIKKYTYLYNIKYENEDFVNKSCLERTVKNLQEKINKLQDIRESRQTRMKGQHKQQVDEIGAKKESQQELKGTISYKLTEDMLKD